LERFWRPVFGSSDTVLLLVAHPVVYHPSTRALELSYRNSGGRPPATQEPIQVPPRLLDGSDMVPVLNQYVGFGDMLSATDMCSFLARERKTPRIRQASRAEFADLKDAPTVLIGAFTNRWTMELCDKLYFRFTWSDAHKPQIEQEDGKRRWELPDAPPDGSSSEDYLLVTRVLNSSTGKPFVVLAGLRQTGTEAAGYLMSNPAEIGAITRQLPSGWENKNLQLILHVKVIGGGPAKPEPVAHHVW
jgi:hypothetical protein